MVLSRVGRGVGTFITTSGGLFAEEDQDPLLMEQTYSFIPYRIEVILTQDTGGQAADRMPYSPQRAY